MQPQARQSAPRISLRPAAPGDAGHLKAWRAEPSVARHQPLGELSLAQLRAELVAQNVDDLYRGRGEKFQWIVLADREPVGWITLVVTNWQHGLGEIGYALSTPYQRRGITREALHQLLTDLFRRTSLERIEARCAVDNEPSLKVLEAVGFAREGVLRGYFELAGRRVDNYLYAILREDLLG
ncbi:MAG: GNAT family N-acetyltransferase [Thermoanaerobaculia bacterium]